VYTADGSREVVVKAAAEEVECICFRHVDRKDL
jgi:hypothetical protein